MHQIFRHARPRQFTASGRKRRIIQERDRRTAQALSHFDQGAGVWASLKTILRELRVIEARRDPDDQATWSLATLKRSLARLETSGVEQRHGIHHEGRKKWGTRKRTLHPERLLPRSECEPSIRSNVSRRCLECDPLEVKDFNTSGSPAKNHHPNLNQKNDDDSHWKDFLNPTPKSQPKISGREKQKPKTYQERLAQFKATAKAAILQIDAKDCRLRCGDTLITQITPEVVDGILEDVIQRAHDAETVICSTNYLLSSYARFMDSENIIEAARPPALAAPAPTPAAPPQPLVVCSPKATKRSRLREEAKLKRDHRREKAKLERNRKLAREKQIQADELDRRREEERRSMMLAESLKQNEAYRNKVYRASAEGIAINKREQRERLARAHPDWSLAVALTASNGQQ